MKTILLSLGVTAQTPFEVHKLKSEEIEKVPSLIVDRMGEWRPARGGDADGSEVGS